jgi:hypothetical protein
VQVGAVVRVAVADQHRVDVGCCHALQQPRQGGVPRVHHDPEPVVLDEVPAAGLPGCGPGTTAAQHRHPHAATVAPVSTRGPQRPRRSTGVRRCAARPNPARPAGPTGVSPSPDAGGARYGRPTARAAPASAGSAGGERSSTRPVRWSVPDEHHVKDHHLCAIRAQTAYGPRRPRRGGQRRNKRVRLRVACPATPAHRRLHPHRRECPVSVTSGATCSSRARRLAAGG